MLIPDNILTVTNLTFFVLHRLYLQDTNLATDDVESDKEHKKPVVGRMYFPNE